MAELTAIGARITVDLKDALVQIERFKAEIAGLKTELKSAASDLKSLQSVAKQTRAPSIGGGSSGIGGGGVASLASGVALSNANAQRLALENAKQANRVALVEHRAMQAQIVAATNERFRQEGFLRNRALEQIKQASRLELEQSRQQGRMQIEQMRQQQREASRAASGGRRGFLPQGVEGVARGLGFWGWTGAALLGNIGAQAVRGAFNFGTRQVGATFDAVAENEAINQSMQTLVARRLMAEQQGLSATDALQRAMPETAAIRQWSMQKAVKSPFSEGDIVGSFQKFMTVGFSMQEAKTYTDQMVDLASAYRLTGDETTRLAKALGDVKSRGYLTAEEVRQFVNARMDIQGAVANVMGVTREQVMVLQKEKKVTSDIVLRAFESVAASDPIKGAAKRMAESWGGLKETMGDIKTFTLRELGTGTFEALRPYVIRFSDFMQEKIFGGDFKRLGEQMGVAVAGGMASAEATFNNVRNTIADLQARYSNFRTLMGQGMPKTAISTTLQSFGVDPEISRKIAEWSVETANAIYLAYDKVATAWGVASDVRKGGGSVSLAAQSFMASLGLPTEPVKIIEGWATEFESAVHTTAPKIQAAAQVLLAAAQGKSTNAQGQPTDQRGVPLPFDNRGPAALAFNLAQAAGVDERTAFMGAYRINQWDQPVQIGKRTWRPLTGEMGGEPVQAGLPEGWGFNPATYMGIWPAMKWGGARVGDAGNAIDDLTVSLMQAIQRIVNEGPNAYNARAGQPWVNPYLAPLQERIADRRGIGARERAFQAYQQAGGETAPVRDQYYNDTADMRQETDALLEKILDAKTETEKLNEAMGALRYSPAVPEFKALLEGTALSLDANRYSTDLWGASLNTDAFPSGKKQLDDLNMSIGAAGVLLQNARSDFYNFRLEVEQFELPEDLKRRSPSKMEMTLEGVTELAPQAGEAFKKFVAPIAAASHVVAMGQADWEDFGITLRETKQAVASGGGMAPPIRDQYYKEPGVTPRGNLGGTPPASLVAAAAAVAKEAAKEDPAREARYAAAKKGFDNIKGMDFEMGRGDMGRVVEFYLRGMGVKPAETSLVSDWVRGAINSQRMPNGEVNNLQAALGGMGMPSGETISDEIGGFLARIGVNEDRLQATIRAIRAAENGIFNQLAGPAEPAVVDEALGDMPFGDRRARDAANNRLASRNPDGMGAGFSNPSVQIVIQVDAMSDPYSVVERVMPIMVDKLQSYGIRTNA